MNSIEKRVNEEPYFDNFENVAVLEETAEIKEKLFKYSENKELISNIYESMIQREDYNKDYSSELNDFFEIVKDSHILGNIYLNLNNDEQKQLIEKTVNYLSNKKVEPIREFVYNSREPYFIGDILTNLKQYSLEISFMKNRDEMKKRLLNNQDKIIQSYNFWDMASTFNQKDEEIEDKRVVLSNIFPELYKRSLDVYTRLFWNNHL